ncbi:unnamed protein product [Orchesella dallaii]|uniref:Gustatory receptor n=1 Tax=Orchesella dallaii TaxID=48710 RepID=A0ABP1QG66_9HEXA
MGWLFSTTNKSLVDGMEKLSVLHLLNPPPIFQDIVGVLSVGLVAFMTMGVLCLPILTIFFDVDPLCILLEPFHNGHVLLSVTVYLVRYIFFALAFTRMARWYCFIFIHFVVVLVIANKFMDGILKIVQNPEDFNHLPNKPNNSDSLKEKVAWQRFIIRVILLNRSIRLLCNFWSRNVGWLIFTILVLGVWLWAASNYALMALYTMLPQLLILVCVWLSTICSVIFVVLATYVAQVEKKSNVLVGIIRRDLRSYKMGRRYASTMDSAKISTPFFSFEGSNLISLFRIPFDVTVNIVLTFPPKI